MGCTASRLNNTFLTTTTPTTEEPSPPLSSSHSPHTSSSHSSSHSHSCPPVPRALSLPTPLVHHPPLKKGDTHHLVSLTSTTYGSLLLLNHSPPPRQPPPQQQQQPHIANSKISTDPKEFSSPDSVINTWELMDGLEDDDFDMVNDFSAKPRSSIFERSSFGDGFGKKFYDSFESLKSWEIVDSANLTASSKPLWKHLSEEALLAKLDPNVVSSYRRALSSRQLGYKNIESKTKSLGSSPLNSSLQISNKNWFFLPGTEDRIVVYCTSLRGIRKTYEDCCAVRMIFRGFRVAVDERDISMDSAYRKELQSALSGKVVSLPQVFIRGKYVGGAEEIKQLHEVGELGNLLEGFPAKDLGLVCESCGDARFIPCPNCSGSRKVFDEEEGQLRRCSDCNENGLIRCPSCCS